MLLKYDFMSLDLSNHKTLFCIFLFDDVLLKIFGHYCIMKKVLIKLILIEGRLQDPLQIDLLLWIHGNKC